jgi:hypothetical protein
MLPLVKNPDMACTIRVAIASVLALVLACNQPPAETKATERSEPAPSAGLLDQYEEAKRKTMCVDAQRIALAVEMHLVTDPGTCPADVAALVQAKLLPRVPDSAPGWTITCNEAEVVVSAPGPDERMGTSDDVVYGGQASCTK